MGTLKQPIGAIVEGVEGATPVDTTVSSSVLPDGAATSNNQDTIIAAQATVAKQNLILTALAGLAVTLGLILTDLQAKADLTETQPVAVYDSTGVIPAGNCDIGVTVTYTTAE